MKLHFKIFTSRNVYWRKFDVFFLFQDDRDKMTALIGGELNFQLKDKALKANENGTNGYPTQLISQTAWNRTKLGSKKWDSDIALKPNSSF